MGYFDNIGQAIGGTASQSAADFINSHVDEALTSVGVPSSSNLTAAEIEAGFTAQPPQETVGAKKADSAAVANAGPAVVIKKVIPYAPILIIAVAAYFLMKGKR